MRLTRVLRRPLTRKVTVMVLGIIGISILAVVLLNSRPLLAVYNVVKVESTVKLLNETTNNVSTMETHLSSNFTKSVSTSSSSNEGLNTHVWYGLCLKTLETLCQVPHFPNFPDIRETTNRTNLTRTKQNNFAQRLFGFLRPPESGLYRFAISSDNSSEIWLSSNGKWQDGQLIARAGEKETSASSLTDGFDVYISQISDEIKLEQGEAYFIDILHVEAGGLNHLQVSWMRPNGKVFEILEGKFLSRFLADNYEGKERRLPKYDHRIPEPLSCTKIRKNAKNKYFSYENTSYIDFSDIWDVLPQCDYEPSYMVHNRKLGIWEAVNDHVHHTWSYPLPHWSAMKNFKHWNFNITKVEAEAVVSKFVAELDSKHSR